MNQTQCLRVLSILFIFLLAGCGEQQTRNGESISKITTTSTAPVRGGDSTASHDTTTAAAPAGKDSSTAPGSMSTAHITYHAVRVKSKDSGLAALKKQYPDTTQRNFIYGLSRADKNSVSRLDTLIVPDTLLADFNQYAPFPQSFPYIKDIHKIVLFSYPIQAFAAYENGRLVHWGPVSMGKKDTKTPTGLHFANWKAEQTISTVKDEWVLNWNFNIMNKDGVGWHEYAMPGYPASHSCLRLHVEDAKYLYTWADQWVLQGKDKLVANGTPVIVYGDYPWGQRRPWRALLQDPKANDISPDALQKEVEPFMAQILAAQKTRDSVRAKTGK